MAAAAEIPCDTRTCRCGRDFPVFGIERRCLECRKPKAKAPRKVAVRQAITPRERDLINLVSKGLKNREIGEALGLSYWTIPVCLNRMFRKFGVHTRQELAQLGLAKP